MALGGVLADLSISLRLLIPVSFLATSLFFLPLFFSGDFKRFVGFDPETETVRVSADRERRIG